VSQEPDSREVRMAETVRQIVTRRERAPRSPRLERALKRLIWRYTGEQEFRVPDATGRGQGEREEDDFGQGTPRERGDHTQIG
jgi:hypothetical protein